MYAPADLPDTIPLFPLSGALLLPRARLPLHIFEPRYLAMLDDTLRSDSRLIGMVQTGEDEDDLYKIGCAGRVTSFTETPEKTYMITLSGVSRFQIGRVQPGFSPYLRAKVSWLAYMRDLGKVEQDPDLDRQEFLALLDRYFKHAGLDTEWDPLKQADDEVLINALSALCPFGTEDKQMLLEAPTLPDRRALLVSLMEFALFDGAGKDRMQ